MNSTWLMGRLTDAPELKKTTSGISVCSFTVAVSRAVKGGENKADFIDCVAWRGTAEFISKWFGKGEMISLRGKIQTRSYEDKNGNYRKVVEVVAEEVKFCGSKRNSKSDEPSLEDEAELVEVIDDEDLPF